MQGRKIGNSIVSSQKKEIKIGGIMMKKKNEITSGLGVALKHYRQARNMSLAELSEKSDVSASYINRIENNERKAPSIVLLNRLSEALSIPIESLLSISNPIDKNYIPNLAEVILKTNFELNGKIVGDDMKINLIDLFELITTVSSEDEDKNKIIYQILDKVDNLKCAL